MYKKTMVFLIILLSGSLGVYSEEPRDLDKSKSLLFVDTYCNDKYSYNNFFEFVENAGYVPEYVNLYELKNKDISRYDTVVLLISARFMNSGYNIFFKDVINEIQKFVDSKNKTICLLFPDIVIKPEQLLNAKEIIKDANILSSNARRTFKPWINEFFGYSLQKKRFYKTALFPKPEKNKDDLEKQDKTLDKEEGLDFYYCVNSQTDLLLASFLPINNKYCDVIRKLFPFGLYIKDLRNDNHVFLFKSPAIFFNESDEDFRINPISVNLQNKLNRVLQEVIIEIKAISEKQEIEKLRKGEFNIELSEKFSSKFYQKQKKLAREERAKYIDHKLYDWCKNEIWAGWIDLEAYDGDKLEIGVENIYTANLNLLWIRFDPELYLSKNGISVKDKDKYLDRIYRFTKALKQRFEFSEKILPKIFMGVELTGNFKNRFSFDSMKDIYFNNYTKIPSPFDFENFWKSEFFEPFDSFVDIWNESIGNGIKIDGVFFDFEMYHAQNQESSYPSLSDFSDSTWDLYQQKTDVLSKEEKDNLQNQNIEKRINHLYKKDQLDNYFCVLREEACLLGKKIREHIKIKLPDVIIAAYMPVIPSSWFYLGILSGLSTKKEPIILATFNNKFFTHYQWLVGNNIYCFHISVILLSKLKNENDFNIINSIKQNHDGVWFNRFSRLGYQHEDEKWWSVESTSLDYKLVVKKIGNIVNK